VLRGERVAITTGCLNRIDHLKKSISTWTSIPEVDVVVVVDWGSTPPVAPELTRLDERVVCVRTEQGAWQNSRCHNLEFAAASAMECDLVLRVDNDVSVAPNFFRRHAVFDGGFYAVDCHAVPKKLDDKRNLCGTIFAAVRHWRRVNGYNERLVQYGYEDEDLFARLEASGLTWRRCDLSTLDHSPHPDSMRLANLACSRMSPVVSKSTDASQLKDFLITLSRQIAETRPWTLRDRRTSWELTRTTSRCWEAREK